MYKSIHMFETGSPRIDECCMWDIHKSSELILAGDASLVQAVNGAVDEAVITTVKERPDEYGDEFDHPKGLLASVVHRVSG